MKVKDSSSISNKKKNALPSSKLLKPKKFKTSIKSTGEGKNQSKIKLIGDNIKADLASKHIDNIELAVKKRSPKPKESKKSSSKSKKENNLNASISINSSPSSSDPTIKIPTLFDFVNSQKNVKSQEQIKSTRKSTTKTNTPKTEKSLKNTPKSEKKISSKSKLRNSSKLSRDSTTFPTLSDFVNTPEEIRIKAKDKTHSKSKIKPETGLQKNIKSRSDKTKPKPNKQISKTTEKKQKKDKPSKTPEKDQENENDKSSVDKCKLKPLKVAAVTQGLLKLVEDASSQNKLEILDEAKPVFMQVECIKIPICPIKQLRFRLPHPLLDDTADVLLITSDLKGHKIFPDKAVEHYEELLASLDINFITKVMPFKMVKKEYSQYEMRRKLVNQFDTILADSRIIKSLPSILGKFVVYKHKMPIPVNLSINKHKLKKHLQEAMCKTQMTVKSNGHCSMVQVGHSKMKASEIAANIVEVAKSLETSYPGGWRNVRSLMIKTANSTSLPVYLSLLSPNEVRIPVEERPRPKPVEGELSTMLGYNVLVTHDNNVILKKVEDEEKIDDSKDEEILEEAKKYIESSKTVRYDESSDEEKNEKDGSESDEDGEAITKAMEKKLMNKYEKKQSKKVEEEEGEDDEEDDEEDEEEEESEIIPLAGKKRKSKETKKQSGPPAKKSASSIAAKGKDKTADKKTASPGFKKPQMRGTRGGKKNKLSKDQRKALIKRKKAGKK